MIRAFRRLAVSGLLLMPVVANATDTPQTISSLQTLFADGVAAGSITPQTMRNFAVSTINSVTTPIGTTGNAIPLLNGSNVWSNGQTFGTPTTFTATTTAPQIAASFFLPLASPSTTIAEGMPVTGTSVPANDFVSYVSGGTTPVTGRSAPYTYLNANIQDLAVSNSTGILPGMMVQDANGSLNATAIVAGVRGAAASSTNLTSPTAASGQQVITVTSGGTSCPLGSLIYDSTTPTAILANGGGQNQVIATTATTVTVASNLSATIVNTDVVTCYPDVVISNTGNTSTAITATDAYTFYPAITLTAATTSIVGTGATLTFTPQTSTASGALLSTSGTLNIGSAGLSINGQPVFQSTYGNVYQNDPQGVLLIGLGAGAALTPVESLMTAVGWHAANKLISPNSESTVFGYNSIGNLINGGYITAFGVNTLGTCVYGCSSLTLMGTDAARNSTSLTTSVGIGNTVLVNNNGANNIGIGDKVLQGQVGGAATGSNNTVGGEGSFSGTSLTTANSNSAWGALIGIFCSTCNQTTEMGWEAGESMTTDSLHALFGYQAGRVLAGASTDTCIGAKTCFAEVTGSGVTMVGQGSGFKATGGPLTLLGNNVASVTLVTGTGDVIIGTSNACDVPTSSTSSAFIACAGGAALLQITGGATPATSIAALSGAMQVGSLTALTLVGGEFGLSKITASGTAPGAAGAKLALVCGTTAGTAKLIAYAGTSTTAATVLDNIGTGVTGC